MEQGPVSFVKQVVMNPNFPVEATLLKPASWIEALLSLLTQCLISMLHLIPTEPMSWVVGGARVSWANSPVPGHVHAMLRAAVRRQAAEGDPIGFHDTVPAAFPASTFVCCHCRTTAFSNAMSSQWVSFLLRYSDNSGWLCF